MTRLAVAGGVGVITRNDVVYIAPLPRGPILVLEGTSRLIWSAALGGDREDVVARVAEAAGVETAEIRLEVENFMADLVGRGLIAPVSS